MGSGEEAREGHALLSCRKPFGKRVPEGAPGTTPSLPVLEAQLKQAATVHQALE